MLSPTRPVDFKPEQTFPAPKKTPEDILRRILDTGLYPAYLEDELTADDDEEAAPPAKSNGKNGSNGKGHLKTDNYVEVRLVLPEDMAKNLLSQAKQHARVKSVELIGTHKIERRAANPSSPTAQSEESSSSW